MTPIVRDVVNDINHGLLDEELDKIAMALRARRKIVVLKQAELATFKVSDEVRLTNISSPRYLEGIDGKVAAGPDKNGKYIITLKKQVVKYTTVLVRAFQLEKAP